MRDKKLRAWPFDPLFLLSDRGAGFVYGTVHSWLWMKSIHSLNIRSPPYITICMYKYVQVHFSSMKQLNSFGH